ncbi:MAG: acyltransferase [bacterium]|nr:acyltransferase [bacterium]
MNANTDKTRLQYIDWLRIFAVFMLIPFHTGTIFNHCYNYVKNETASSAVDTVNIFINIWHMPLFMFLAGISTFYALKFRSGKQYMKERFKRLFVPLMFGTVFIISPQAYLRMFGRPDQVWPQGFLHNAPAPGYDANFFEFFPNFFNGIFPNGNLEWGHLWFLAYLFTFSLLALPIFLFFKSEKGKQFIGRMGALAQKRFGIFIFMVPIMIFEVSLRWKFPGLQNLVADWANFLTYITLFIYGYMVMSDEGFMKGVDRNWKGALIIAIAFAALRAGAYGPGLVEGQNIVLIYILGMVIRALALWCFMVGLLGLGRSMLNRGGKVLKYLSEAALPYYILHQTVVLVTGFYVVQLDLSIFAKYMIIIGISFMGVAFIYEVLVKRVNIIRFCFGMKTLTEGTHRQAQCMLLSEKKDLR